MVIMALEHTRDFLSLSAMSFSPEDLSRTTPALHDPLDYPLMRAGLHVHRRLRPRCSSFYARARL